MCWCQDLNNYNKSKYHKNELIKIIDCGIRNVCSASRHTSPSHSYCHVQQFGLASNMYKGQRAAVWTISSGTKMRVT